MNEETILFSISCLNNWMESKCKFKDIFCDYKLDITTAYLKKKKQFFLVLISKKLRVCVFVYVTENIYLFKKFSEYSYISFSIKLSNNY